MKEPLDDIDHHYGRGTMPVTAREVYDADKEVFGNEENAGVSGHAKMTRLFPTDSYSDPLPNTLMAACCRVDDR